MECDKTLMMDRLATRLGSIFTNFETDFWFCVAPSICDQYCPAECSHGTKRYIYKSGLRFDKLVQLGQGGFGSVYEANLHGSVSAVKQSLK